MGMNVWTATSSKKRIPPVVQLIFFESLDAQDGFDAFLQSIMSYDFCQAKPHVSTKNYNHIKIII